MKVIPSRLRSLSWASLSLSIFFSCRAAPQTSPSTLPPTESSNAGVATSDHTATNKESALPHPSLAHEQQVTERTQNIINEVAQARSLALTGEVQVEVVDRQEIRAFALNSLYEHQTPEHLQLLGRLDSSLGILPMGANAEQILLDMLEQAVMGVYDPKTKKLMIGSHVQDGMMDMVIGHEIAHGLQDMHFNLTAMQQPLRGNSDGESARTFLVEGDAQASYLAWRSGEGGLRNIDPKIFATMGDQALELAGLAKQPILTRMLQLPYADGTATIAALVDRQGWQAVDQLYADLPTTTEQMLHVDKLVEREPAIPVRINSELLITYLPGYQLVWEDNLGEAALLAMLADVESPAIARKASAGWGGDRLIVLAHPDRKEVVVVGLITWDSANDMREFVTSFRRYLDQHVQKERYLLLQRAPQQVFFATYVPQESADAVKKNVWNIVSVQKAK